MVPGAGERAVRVAGGRTVVDGCCVGELRWFELIIQIAGVVPGEFQSLLELVLLDVA